MAGRYLFIVVTRASKGTGVRHYSPDMTQAEISDYRRAKKKAPVTEMEMKKELTPQQLVQADALYEKYQDVAPDVHASSTSNRWSRPSAPACRNAQSKCKPQHSNPACAPPL